jgi:hypothetical protein
MRSAESGQGENDEENECSLRVAHGLLPVLGGGG